MSWQDIIKVKTLKWYVPITRECFIDWEKEQPVDSKYTVAEIKNQLTDCYLLKLNDIVEDIASPARRASLYTRIKRVWDDFTFVPGFSQMIDRLTEGRWVRQQEQLNMVRTTYWIKLRD
jgi:hypothetical protein